MYGAVGLSAGLAALLTLVAIRSSGKHRLLWSTGAVVALFYAGWTITVGSVVGQFARSVEDQARQSAG